MGLSETLLFYSVIGFAVAVAVWVAGEEPLGQRAFRSATAVLFWPLYLPILLTPKETDAPRPILTPTSSSPPADELDLKIAGVESELEAAFSGLEGWAEGALFPQSDRTAELRAAWNSQAERIREMDRLLAGAEIRSSDRSDALAHDPIDQSERARRDNFSRLRQVRDKAYGDLTTTLARVRELVSLIHLAKYTGAPASRAEQLVAEIAASVEGLSEVAGWRG